MKPDLEKAKEEIIKKVIEDGLKDETPIDNEKEAFLLVLRKTTDLALQKGVEIGQEELLDWFEKMIKDALTKEPLPIQERLGAITYDSALTYRDAFHYILEKLAQKRKEMESE